MCIQLQCFYSALLTVDCLAVILEDVEDWFPLGELLGINEKILNSIDDYYSGKEASSFIYNMVSRWFREGPEEPIKLLIAGLKSLGKDEISTQVANLFLFGMNLHYKELVMSSALIGILSSNFMQAIHGTNGMS